MQGIRPQNTDVFRGSITLQTGAYFQNKTGSDYPCHANVDYANAVNKKSSVGNAFLRSVILKIAKQIRTEQKKQA